MFDLFDAVVYTVVIHVDEMLVWNYYKWERFVVRTKLVKKGRGSKFYS